MDILYDNISKAIEQDNTFVMGEFIAKLGSETDDAEVALGMFVYEERNHRGDIPLEFLLHHRLHDMNSCFKWYTAQTNLGKS